MRKSVVAGLSMAVILGAAIPLHADAQARPGAQERCPAAVTAPGLLSAGCYPPGQLAVAENGLPFAPINAVGIVRRVTHLAPILFRASPTGYPASGFQRYPQGPPDDIFLYFGRFPPRTGVALPGSAGDYLWLDEYLGDRDGVLSGPGHVFQRLGHEWIDEGNVGPQRAAFQMHSNLPAATVRTVGNELMAAARLLVPRPRAPGQMDVSPPRSVRVGRSVTLWVLNAARPNTREVPTDFDFTLSGGWRVPTTVTPDGSQACGGDNVAGQPYLRGGRWHFRWGDCQELGLVLTATRPGLHAVSFRALVIPLNRRGQMQIGRERPVTGGGSTWSVAVR